MKQIKKVESTMNRWMQSYFVMALTATSSVLGWGGVAPTTQGPYLESDFPMKPNQQWFMKETYLIMKPYEDDNDYASKLTTTGDLASQINMSMKLEKPEYDWFSGVRVGIGRYLAHHDKWDISLFTTYYYAEEEDESTPRRAKDTLLTPLWIPNFDGGATKGKTIWRLNFFNWDLSVGRQYNMLKTIVAHPFIGLRAALIYKKYRTTYADQFNSPAVNRLLRDKFTASNNYWGLGPRTGVDLQFNMERGWSFLGNLSAALLFGHYDLSEEISTNVSTTGTTNAASRKHYNVKDNRYTVRTNLDAGLGLGWETWLNQHTVRLAPSVLFEASCWFDTNQMFVPKKSPSASPLVFTNFRRQGNLILMGFSFNLQADF